jgi:hypothetical protein
MAKGVSLALPIRMSFEAVTRAISAVGLVVFQASVCYF